MILYKLKLIESRLMLTDMVLIKLLWNLGFTDQSHLNHIFKKYKGKTPSSYRKENI
ncbi:helix-turn-helix domain-containing protein [Dyadobacter jejuensis]|uniref:helix-turn-helix domain-containing protein n=1 Tax=Dyadobacter jejuensis TaxID=1082580 RepID=UPI0035B674D9